jgi:DNA-binding NtrC family response regulator
MTVSEGDVLEPASLPERIVNRTPQTGSESPASGLSSLAQTVAQATEKAERDTIQDILLKTGGNREKAAESLGIGRATLYRKLKQYGIE